MTFRLFIHAINIHQGGGRSLLVAILGALPSNLKLILSLDKRMPLSDKLTQAVKIKRVKPTLAQRFMAEKWLLDNVEVDDVVLCFGNLPPLFKLRGRVVVFVQNRYLVDDVKFNGFSFRVRLRLEVERLWLSSRMANVDAFVVQTPSMKKLLEARTKGEIPVRVLPFMAVLEGYGRKVHLHEKQRKKEFDFLYVASGEPHKNHRILIEAWCLLAEEGLFPSLKLTLDINNFAQLCSWLQQKIEQCRLNVENMGSLSYEQIGRLYSQSGALIYPSTFESFGLPLIEARQAGLPVLASELDYVRDVLDPEQTFDPDSAVSIARAVKRFMDVDEPDLPLLDAAGFLKEILKESK